MTVARPWQSVFGALLALYGAGCQLVIDTDAQCSADADCQTLFGAGHVCGARGVCSAARVSSGNVRGLPSRWACLATTPPAVEEDRNRPVQLTLAPYDYVTGQPVRDAVARVCAPGDLACTRPVEGERPTDDRGLIEFGLPYGFAGYFELTSRAMLPLLMSDGVLTQDARSAVPMLAQTTLGEAATAGGERYDPELGVVLLDVLDCDGVPADGVRIESMSMPENRAYYFDDKRPSRAIDRTQVDMLGQPPEAVSLAAFLNVRPGIMTFRAQLADSGQPLTSITLQVRAQTMTLTRFRPGRP